MANVQVHNSGNPQFDSYQIRDSKKKQSHAPPEVAAVKLSPEQVTKKTAGLFAEYLGPGGDIVEAIECMKELIPGNFFGAVVTKLHNVMDTLEKKNTDREKIGALVQWFLLA